MSRIFVDSSVWIDHLRGVASRETRTLRALLRRLDPRADAPEPDEIMVGDIVLVEVLRGIDDDRQRRRARTAPLAFETVRVGGTTTALLAVDHYVALRRLGQTVWKTIDCLIAAWCIDVPLLQADQDFLPFARHRALRLA